MPHHTTHPESDSQPRRRTNQPQPQAAPEPAGDGTAWRQVLDALHAAGEQAGANAADWWAQDTVGGRASGDIADRARRILRGLDDDLDPAVLNALPICDLAGQYADAPTEADLYTDATPAGAPGRDDLDTERRDEAIAAFRDGYDTGAHARVAEHCRTALPDHSPDGSCDDGCDRAHERDPRRRTA
jgi:hypothetical protein